MIFFVFFLGLGLGFSGALWLVATEGKEIERKMAGK